MNPTIKTITYRTKDGTQTGFVLGAGEIVNGLLTVPVGTIVENHNLEIVEEKAIQNPLEELHPESKEQPPTAPSAAPAASVASQATADIPQPSVASDASALEPEQINKEDN